MEYQVLKNGRTEGPFTEAALVAEMEKGRFTPDDLGQPLNSPYWTPLRRLFEVQLLPPPLPTSPERAGTFKGRILELKPWATELFRLFPLETGAVCLAIGCALVILSHAPALIFGPWLVGALACGGRLMLRNRLSAGLGLCAAAIFIPAILAAIFLKLSSSP